jgi:hypothetical protein
MKLAHHLCDIMGTEEIEKVLHQRKSSLEPQDSKNLITNSPDRNKSSKLEPKSATRVESLLSESAPILRNSFKDLQN